MYNFDEVIDRCNSDSMKYDWGHIRHPELPADYLPMWVADMDFACPQPVLDAMKARLDRRILGYSIITDPGYYELVAQWMKRRYNWESDPSLIMFSPGVEESMYIVLEQLTSPGDSVLLMTPSYQPFDNAIRAKDRSPLYCPLQFSDGHYSIDFTDFERKAAQPQTTLFFLCNPHNPTGRVWSIGELDRIADICLNNNVFIVSDDIHADIIRKEFCYSPISKRIPGEKRLITLTAPTKTFNIAGNKLSHIVFNDPDLFSDWRHRNVIDSLPNPLSIDACRAAYTLCDDWVNSLNAYLDGNFMQLNKLIRQRLPLAEICHTEGTYLAWINLSRYGITEHELKRRIILNGLFIMYGSDFVANGDGFIRINLACPRSIIQKAVERIVCSVT